MSLLQIHNQNRQNAMTGYDRLSQLESNRDQYNDQAKAQKKSKIGSSIGSGVALGLMVGGPYGIAAGAGVALLGALF